MASPNYSEKVVQCLLLTGILRNSHDNNIKTSLVSIHLLIYIMCNFALNLHYVRSQTVQFNVLSVIWAILAIFRYFGFFGLYWLFLVISAILDILGYFGYFGLFWLFSMIWPILAVFGDFGYFR